MKTYMWSGADTHQAQAARQHKLGRKHELQAGMRECQVVGVYHAAIAIEGMEERRQFLGKERQTVRRMLHGDIFYEFR